ncbi:LamG domain-containing protein [Ralstonia mannitolilytica]|uniref:LamG domain-containing protein n=1 Tax=Ralstonia mannitolilytica TaxID=105219 RepID=UPI000CEEB5E9|nr:LamG domain-containing protein [Ralstonia mannitolilytica]
MAITPIGKVVLLLHCDDSSGTTLTDSSPYGLNAKLYGTAATSATQSMFGGRSLLTGSANGNYAAVGTNQLLDFGTGDFTIEVFLSPLSQGADGGAILGRWNGTAKDFLLMRAGDGSLQVFLNGSQVLQTAAGDLPTTGFTHIALTRQSGTLNAWIGGVNKGSVSFPGAVNFTRGTPVYIGQSNLAGGATWLQAYFDDIRITNGLAQYTANFAPPSSALASDATVDPYVTSVLHMDGANGSTTIDDQGGAIWTANGNASISTAQSKFGGASCFFDGSGDYLSSPSSASFDLLGGDFTIEAWVYAVALNSGGSRVFSTGGGAVAYAPNGIHILAQVRDGVARLELATGGGSTNVALASTAAVPTGAWAFLTYCYSNGVGYVGVNGVVTSGAMSGAGRPASTPTATIATIHGEGGAAPNGWNGYIDEVRITKGLARYTGNFTPPTAPFPNNLPSRPAMAVKTPRAYIRAYKWYPFASAKPAVRTGKPNIMSGLKDAIFGGAGKIAGTVDVAPSTPVSRKVWLLDERCMLPVRSTWSDPVTGAYQFRWLDTGRTYTVQAYDYTKTYRAVIANGVIPDPM